MRRRRVALPDGWSGDGARHFAATTAAIIGGLVAAGGSVAGAAMSSSASKHGADLQKQYSDEALAYQKEQDAYKRQTEANRYGTMMSGLDPYRASGETANSAMLDFLGLHNPPPVSATTTPMIGAAPTNAQPAVSRVRHPDDTTAPMVTMIAPDGSQKPVPADQMDHWTKMGARPA